MPCDNTTKTSSDIEHADWTTGTSQHYNVRFDSASSQASQSSGDICRICHCESDPQNPLLTPCYCSGSLKYVHQACLQQWLTASETNACELCKFPFIMHTKIKPFNEWRSLDISGIERRRLCCSVLFHCAAALCVIWSLCVLIERAADDVKNGQIDWPFWTKLAVVAVGLTGGIVFMYIQCKAYLHLCHRWKARNRILLIQNAPEKVHPLSQPSPLAQQRVRHSSTVQAHTANAGHRSVNVNIDVNNGSPRPPTSVTDYVPATLADVDDVSGSCVRHQRYENLPSSPHHMLQHADLDVDSVAYHNTAGVPRSHGKHHYLHHQNIGHGHHINGHQHQHSHYHTQLGQVAVAANIECSQSQNNYERDFALDDVVSQISSFRPCPQGSGSMTPFHDSIHNVLEHSEDSSRVSVNDLCVGSRQDLSADGLSSDTGREHALQLSSFSGSGDHKAPSISSGVSHAVANGLGGFVYKPHTKRYSNSSIFLENRDILNDSVAMDLDLDSTPYIKPDYRHSSILTPPESESDKLEQYMGKDLRRYSDTKLLGNLENDARNSTLECKNELESDPTTANSHMHPLLKQHSDTVNASNAKDVMLDAALPISPLSSSRIQQLERPLLWHSIQTVNVGRGIDTITTPSAQRQIDKARFFFKSLPNLSSSCESLIKK